ncbi:ParB/RepB/Spo0J family partition protein [Acetobacter senegalensis]|uniref:ParB/RepB/Spo0J family partition protein n=1 Tax=Acetobacter senegalensis TaxID=446692 RepID=UPI002651FE4A|nr:ParB N-terminal domain-containing protein [Acetobacter senegalensis]MDN7351796.1 ParB N-terminal domain-containing protein [Acetobacter senegalensis]
MNMIAKENPDAMMPDQALIPVTQIDVGERLRTIDPDYAAMIAASMQEEGQRTPIEVRKAGKRYKLIAGGHRLAALQLAQIENAWCVVKKVTDEEAELLEIDENLCRRELSALDKATFLARRKEVYEKLHPEAGHGGDRKSDQNEKLFVLIPAFTQATAEKLGLSRRSIEMAVSRFKHIMPDVREKISSTWLAGSGAQLDALAKETPDMQRQIAEAVHQWPTIKNVSEIIRQLKNQPKKAPPTTYDKLVALWNKADQATKLRFHEFLAPTLELEDVA